MCSELVPLGRREQGNRASAPSVSWQTHAFVTAPRRVMCENPREDRSAYDSHKNRRSAAASHSSTLIIIDGVCPCRCEQPALQVFKVMPLRPDADLRHIRAPLQGAAIFIKNTLGDHITPFYVLHDHPAPQQEAQPAENTTEALSGSCPLLEPLEAQRNQIRNYNRTTTAL